MRKFRPDLHLLTMLTYYGLFRKDDLKNLRGIHFNFGNNTLHLPGHLVKKTLNKKTIVMVPEFVALLKEFGIDKLGPQERVLCAWTFGGKVTRILPENWKPTLENVRKMFPTVPADKLERLQSKAKVNYHIGRGTFSRLHKAEIDKIGLTRKNGTVPTFYCWKHTGACSYIDSGYDLVWVKNQAGHSTLAATNAYLEKMPVNRKDLYNIITQKK